MTNMISFIGVCGREVGIQFIHSNRLDYRVMVIDDDERLAECGLTKTAP